MSPERIAFVRSYQIPLGMVLLDSYCAHDGVRAIRAFATLIPDRFRTLSRQVSTRLLGDENALTEHADSVRSATRYMRDLLDRILPAIESDPGNPILRIDAAERASYIESHCKAMEFGVV